MTKLFNIDCVAGGNTVKQLLSADVLTNKSTVYTSTSAGAIADKSDYEKSMSSSPSPTPTATPTSTPRSRPSKPASTPSSRPLGATTTSPIPSRTPSSPLNTDLCDSWCYQGGKQSRFDARSRCPVDKRWLYDAEDEIWTLPYTKSGPVEKPATPDHTVAYIQLGNEDALTSFCNVVTDGWPMVASPKKTEPTPNNISTSIQAISSSKNTCGDCGDQFSVCQSRCQQARRYQDYIHGVGAPPYVVGHTGPALPPNFTPCGNYCVYEECECLRRYDGRDWAS